jgi:hypothetical protein
MSTASLERLLMSIGKSTFVRYFAEFQNPNISNEEMIDLLPDHYTLKSRRSRTRRVFREGLAQQALSIIASSERVDGEMRKEANRLLERFHRH